RLTACVIERGPPVRQAQGGQRGHRVAIAADLRMDRAQRLNLEPVQHERDSLIVRLVADQADEALKEPHVKPFDITGKPMKGWLLVAPEGLEGDEELADWIRRSVKFVGKFPAKEKESCPGGTRH